MNQHLIKFLQHQANKLRILSINITTKAGSGHPTSCLSAAEICATLFWAAMKYNPNDYHNPCNDRFILSKGHASALLYSIWHLLGKITYDTLLTYRQYPSILEGHPTPRFPYTNGATGSLGMGLSIGVGEAIASRIRGNSNTIYILTGDGEMSEGSNWEAIMLAAQLKLNNLKLIIDANHLGQSEPSLWNNSNYTNLTAALTAFGWIVKTIDGHNISEIHSACTSQTNDQPVAIIAKTDKGHCGISSLENKLGWHGKPLTGDMLTKVLQTLEHAIDQEKNVHYEWTPQLPVVQQNQQHATLQNQRIQKTLFINQQSISTRQAIAIAITDCAAQNQSIVCLDADVKNSTYTELFEQLFPNRFIQCFVAEQNMIGIAIGLAHEGYIPIAATFASFLTRAHDQLRMAAIGKAHMVVIGTHTGIAVGNDGPSQMGLEDIALFANLHGTIVCPADQWAAINLTKLVLSNVDSIVYIRAMRQIANPIYTSQTSFTIGGSHVLKSSADDQLCIVTAGATVHEALLAYELLQKENITISIIDAYSIQPIDTSTIIAYGLKSNNIILTIEDHYQNGGLGQIIAQIASKHAITIHSLFVPSIPQSGNAQDLYAWAGLDGKSIAQTIQTIIKASQKGF